MIVARSAPDPFTFLGMEKVQIPSPVGRTIRDPRLNAGETTGVFVVAGQSNAANYVDTTATLTNGSKIDCVNIYDGGTYAGTDPLLGSDGSLGSIFSRMADVLITAGKYQRVILCPIGRGDTGTSINHWATGGMHNQRLIVVPRRLAALGLSVTAFLWQQGESDTDLGTSQASYAASLAQVIGAPRAFGYNAPWLLAKSTYSNGSVSSAVQAAIAAAINGTTIFAGADTDTLTGTTTNRQVSGNTHFKAAGANAAAVLWRDKIVAAL